MRHMVYYGVTLIREKVRKRLIGERNHMCTDSTGHVIGHV